MNNSDLPATPGTIALGKVAAPPNKEATSDLFYFWIARDQLVERTQIVRTSSTLAQKPVEFVGLVEEVFRQSRQKDMGEEVDRFDADTAAGPPFASAGFGYAKAAILRTDPVCHAPPIEESTVSLGREIDAAKGYGIDRMREENKLAVGRIRNGGSEFAGPAIIDLAYMLGENGGHLNVNGIAGMGTKSSFLLHILLLLMMWAKRVGKPGNTLRTRVVPIVFNVKNFDLFFIDRWSRNWKPEYRDDWKALGISDPQPFANVQFFAPQERGSKNAIRTGRDGVQPYSWGLADIIEQGLFRYLFADDDLGSPNFSALVGAIEEYLTHETRGARSLNAKGPQTFDELPDWIKNDANKHVLGDPHTATRGSLVRRLRGMLLDSDGVLRRDVAHGSHPLKMPADEVPGPLVIDLFGIKDEKLKRFVVAAVFHQLVEMRSKSPVEGLRYVLALDELNRFAPKSGSDAITEMMERVAAEMRSQGIILLGAQQEASRVSPRVIENAGIRAVGRSGTLELTADVWKFLGESARKQAAQLLETEKLLIQPS
ncbi:MAG TPA: ATP-binding protein, partial [Urbifossiella sp.]